MTNRSEETDPYKVADCDDICIDYTSQQTTNDTLDKEVLSPTTAQTYSGDTYRAKRRPFDRTNDAALAKPCHPGWPCEKSHCATPAICKLPLARKDLIRSENLKTLDNNMGMFKSPIREHVKN
ncbi:hypothetical protein M513_00456 [Trichuris suis]|uniref:Uncharacterized protein n=1 Tax=Trichuris suis TaxID=68888 RepID=A0A085MNG7_9BILA|nr:hypothetical protein M513_00456 [Trichuris suis]